VFLVPIKYYGSVLPYMPDDYIPYVCKKHNHQYVYAKTQAYMQHNAPSTKNMNSQIVRGKKDPRDPKYTTSLAKDRKRIVEGT
jgi:hypothetical protein